MRQADLSTRSTPARMLGSPFLAAIDEVASLAEAQGVRVALVGGCAVRLYGRMRATPDVDLIVDGPIDGLRRMHPREAGGVRGIAHNGVPVDLIPVGLIPVGMIDRDDRYARLFEDALDRAVWMAGVPVPVVTLPDLAAMKLIAGRGKDCADLEFILCDAGVRWDDIEHICALYLGIYALDKFGKVRDRCLRARSASGRRACSGR